MRILYINLERGWRGGERQTYLAACALHQQGYDISVMARSQETLAERSKAASLHVLEVNSNLGLYNHLLWHAGRYDVIHVHTAGALTAVALMKWRFKAKVVYTRRTSFSIPEARRARTLKKWQQVDCFVAISESAAVLPQHYGIATHIVPSAIDFVPPHTDEIVAFAHEQQLGGKFVIATCAALSPEKDPLTCVRAMHALWQQRQDFVFLHFGSDGSERQKVESLIHDLGMESVYKLVGFKANIEDMYRLMHIFVLTSLSEGLGSSVLEAFLYEAAVVSTKVGATPIMVGEERGILCEQGDFIAIAEGCNRLLDDEALRRQYTAAAEHYVLEKHSVASMVASYERLYRQSLGLPEAEPESEATAHQ